MRRREFAALVGGAALWPLAARAQQPERVWRVGYLRPGPVTAVGQSFTDAMVQQMRALGYVEGRNLVLMERNAGGHYERLPALAGELVAERPDVIATFTTPAIRAAQRATKTIPIVMIAATDPVGSGFVASLARPGGNITGLSSASTDLTNKGLEILREILPSAKRIAVLMSTNPAHRGQYRALETEARAIGVDLVPVLAPHPSDLNDAFAEIARKKCDASIVLSDAVRPAIVELAARAGLPTLYYSSQLVRAGGLISYGADLHALWRRAAIYIDKILKGAAPADLPVEQPTKFELVVNLKTAKALGLTISGSILARADEVIE